MTISSSLAAGITGLSANANRLSTISDNIANSSTHGYRRMVTDFHSLVLDSGPGRYTAGGVRTTSQRLIDESGALTATGNPTDLAVRGRGFLPVTTSSAMDTAGHDGDILLTSTGSFRRDDAGYLTTPDGQVLMGWPAAADGSIGTVPRDSATGLVPVQIAANQVSGSATDAITLGVNLPASETQDGAAGLPEVMTTDYFDNLGTTRQLGMSFTPTTPAPGGAATNEWTMLITDSASGGAVVGEYVLSFDDSRGAGGTLSAVSTNFGGGYDPATGQLAITVAGGPIDIDIGALGSRGGLSQLAGPFAPISIDRNGAGAGNLTTVEVDADGSVYANFDNGAVQRLYQVPLIDVANPNGLMSQDGQTYSITEASGPMLLWDAGEGPSGDIIGFAREESTVDVASELTQLIQTQRAYSSNAKVIQTVDEMLQETTNLKR